MYKKTGEKIVQLRLIDYESLCIIKDCTKLTCDKRFFHAGYSRKTSDKKNAFAFLWWQCVVVAYAWHHELVCLELNAIKLVDDCFSGKLDACFKDFLNEADVPFLQDFAISKMITESTVMKTLQIFGDSFKRLLAENAV